MNTATQPSTGTAAKYAAALLLVLASSWVLAPRASAQLGSLIVTVTSPTSGASVSGTITVSASVTIIGSLTVAGVQFKLDGVNLGAEDTSAPYTIPWNTTTTNNGSHTLTAVARDLLGVRWTSNSVTVTVSNPPTITSFTPTSGPVGTSLTINGTNFTGATAVRFNGTSANFTVNSATAIQATVPGGATTGPISVTTSGGTATSASSFTVAASAPTITSFTPTSGPVGTSVTISGTSFTGATAVTFNGTSASFTVNSATSITATVPSGATAGPISVTTSGGTATSASSFTVSDTEGTTRIEETDSAVSYVGAWDQGYTGAPGGWSGGSVAFSAQASAWATLSFSGTGVSWIGYRSTNTGIATVYLDGTAVATVDTYAASDTVQAVVFTASGLASGPHTLAVEVTGTKNDASSDSLIVVDAFDVKSVGAGTGGGSTGEMFAPGDVFISLETGPVQWRNPNGTLEQTLVSRVPGTGEGMGFDLSGNLYVTRWCTDMSCSNGNTVEMFNARGQSQGAVGRGYDCAPHAIVFDTAGAAYIGQGGCRGSILKFVPGQSDPIEFVVAPDNQGAFWIDLAQDGCTMFYTSFGPNVKRFDVCTRVQLPDFNAALLPGGAAQDLRVLADGGVLVSSGDVIARLDATGALVQTFAVPGESSPWAGLDLVGDGTFWAGNYESSNVYRFDLATGAVLATFNTGTPPHTVVGVRVRK